MRPYSKQYFERWMPDRMHPCEGWAVNSLLGQCLNAPLKWFSAAEHDLSTQDGDLDLLRDIAIDYRFEVQQDWLVRDGYIYVDKPQRDGDGWYVEIILEELGEKCQFALYHGLIWNPHVQAPAIRESVEYWTKSVSELENPTSPAWKYLERSVHPALEACRQALPVAKANAWLRELKRACLTSSVFKDVRGLDPAVYSHVQAYADQRHVELWIETVQKIDDPESKLFKDVARLPEPLYTPVKNEAFLQKMKVWTPVYERA